MDKDEEIAALQATIDALQHDRRFLAERIRDQGQLIDQAERSLVKAAEWFDGRLTGMAIGGSTEERLEEIQVTLRAIRGDS